MKPANPSGQKPPTPAVPVRQRAQLGGAAASGSVKIKTPEKK